MWKPGCLVAALCLSISHSFIHVSYCARYDKSNSLSTCFGTSTSDEVSSLSIKELKERLSSLNVNYDDVFEKKELIDRLVKAQSESDSVSQEINTSRKPTVESSVLEIPLYLTTMDGSRSIDTTSGPQVTINPTQQPFVTMSVTLPSGSSLRLLVDTACSGLVLRPRVVEQHSLPKLSAPVVMTGAGGTAVTSGLTQLQFRVESRSFGPLQAAVQEIGALPSALDGIIGLSFLQQFAVVEMNFREGKVRFFDDQDSGADASVASSAPMKMVPRLSIYTVPVMIGSRGPVQMLVDSGASCTLVSWEGLKDLGLTKDSKAVQQVSQFGALGSDNVALDLTHRIYVSSQLQLTKGEGVSLAGGKRLAIDVGNIPVLDSMRADGVGGILGADVMMRCRGARFHFRGAREFELLSD